MRQKMAAGGAHSSLLAQDNLRLQTLAKYKAMRDGDTVQYERIDNNLCTIATQKRLALSDSSLELYERTRMAAKHGTARFDVALDSDSEALASGRRNRSADPTDDRHVTRPEVQRQNSEAADSAAS